MQHPDRADASDRMVRAFASSSIAEGFLAKGLLESEGIPVLVKGERQGPYRTGSVELWVPERLLVQARLILEEARADPAWDDADGPDGPEQDEV